MATSEQATMTEYQENDTESEGSEPDYDSDLDSSYSILEDTHARFSNLSIRKKSKSRTGNDLNHSVDVDENEEEIIKKIVEAGQLEKLKVEQCKIYLRKNGLRLSGNKSILIQRIKEHLEVSNGEGEKKYPISSFVLNCKGDACTGDVVMFEQNVYEMFNIASHSASGPPCGKRIVVGRIVKESYGAAKQQHTFTIEVLWSKGEKPLSPLHPLLIKGRNLYRLKTLRQRWDDEGERLKVLMDKHSRGSLARSDRETRIQEKEKRKMVKANRMSMKEDAKSIQSQWNSKATEEMQHPLEPLSFMQRGLINLLPLNMSSHQPPIYKYPNTNQMNSLSERTNHRQPLNSLNHFCSKGPPPRLGSIKQQSCRYYAEGRCHFGDNCKFLHERR